MTPWDWVTSTTGPLDWVAAGGTILLAWLFATDRILTRGQHRDRVADLVKNHDREVVSLTEGHARELAALTAHHGRELVEKDRHVDRVDESRKEWKAAETIQRERADVATASVGNMAESLDGIRRAFEALARVAEEARHDH